MADLCEDKKMEWPLEEIYIKAEPLDPLTELLPSPKLELKPSIKEETDSPSEKPVCSKSLLSTDAHVKMKEEAVAEYEDFVKEEVDILPFSFDEAASSSGSILLNDLNKNSNVGTENVERKTIKAKLRTLECSYCSRKFSYKRDLQRHIMTHTGEKPYECSYCCKKFSLKWDLQRHIFTHTGEQPHECSYCGKKFIRKDDLQSHILNHTGETPHECSYCSKKFIQKKSLQRHIFTHAGEKPHDCPQCSKKFSQKGNLQRHILTHIGKVKAP